MMDGLFENGDITPVGKTAVLTDMMMRCASMTEPVTFTALFEQMLTRFGVKEEEMAGTIHSAAFLLARIGLIQLLPRNDTIGAGTMVRASRSLINFVWDEGEPEEEAA